MEKIQQSQEEKTKSERTLEHFFKVLPESSNDVYEIPQSSLDVLIEQGVTVEHLCREFVRKGFLLHGTGVRGIAELEPRQSWCNSENPENCQQAVYASNDARIPIFMAIVGAIQSNRRSGYSLEITVNDDGSSTEAISFHCSVPVPGNLKGVVYVLPSEKFNSAGTAQLVSLEPVRPVYALVVQPRDFPYPIEQVDEDENKSQV